MKEFLEEYGGIITACILSLILLGTMADLLGADGQISYLFAGFLEGLGPMAGVKVFEGGVCG